MDRNARTAARRDNRTAEAQRLIGCEVVIDVNGNYITTTVVSAGKGRGPTGMRFVRTESGHRVNLIDVVCVTRP